MFQGAILAEHTTKRLLGCNAKPKSMHHNKRLSISYRTEANGKKTRTKIRINAILAEEES